MIAKYAKYTEGICPDGAAILKDGHTMFPQDIVADLNRKSYLEAENERLRSGINTACVNIWSWAYGRKNKHILEIYRNLKAVVSGGRNG